MRRIILLLLAIASCLQGASVADTPIESHKSNKKGKGELAVIAMFQDEAPYLKEWIEFHRLVGVKHFYLYNNLSSDDYQELLHPYIKEGIVELFDIPFDSRVYNDQAKTHNQVQVKAYNDGIRRAAGRFKWVAIIDADEFICPVQDNTIQEALKRYKHASGLAVFWQIYGTSGVEELQAGELLIEKLLWKLPNAHSGLFKSIVKPDFATCMDPHWCKLSAGKQMFLPDGQRFSHHPVYQQLPVDIIRINHYTYRTEKYFREVKQPRRLRWGDTMVGREQVDAANSVLDPVMLKYVDLLKANMNFR